MLGARFSQSDLDRKIVTLLRRLDRDFGDAHVRTRDAHRKPYRRPGDPDNVSRVVTVTSE